jgi:NDP-4-keto-2,6-dideoxyhexose 3-C-methyltransferase
MSIKITTKCRICGNTDLKLVLTLGEQPLSSVFPNPEASDPTVSPLELIRCDKESNKDACGLLQLRHQADLSEMYGTTYGYFSSISPTMVSHLQGKIQDLKAIANPVEGDVILDIGCNDGTLLNAFGKENGYKRVGIDPSSKKFFHNFQSDIEVAFDFFSKQAVRAMIGNKQCKIITSIAMFYDLEDPIDFMHQIHDLLSKDGIWALELSYLPLLCSQLTYDQICHEHVTYFTLSHMNWMMKKTGLKILDVSFNDINGGSFYIHAARDDSDHQPNSEKIDAILTGEKLLDFEAPYNRLRNRVLTHREDVKHFFSLARAAGKKVYGYGASTKGNIVLNYCGITKDDLIAIGDRNPEKDGLTTPGTRIPIISHEKLRKEPADYLFVMIWFLRKEVIQDELEFLMRGGKIVFNLPRLHIVDANNYKRYLDQNFEDLSYSI